LVAIFTAASTHNLVDPLLVMERLSREQASIISDLSESRERLASARRTVQALIARQRLQERQLSVRKGQIEYEIGRLARLRETTGHPHSAPPPTAERPPAMPRGAAATVVTFAYAQLGKSYRWGGEGPEGYDCSGLTLAAWAAAGVRLPHNAAWQWRTVTRISRAELRLGDLIFYYPDIHHVAVYIGAGRMIHAPRPGLWIRIEQADYQPVYGYGRPG
jgi:cell wall-associated NlpC family hydrolase